MRNLQHQSLLLKAEPKAARKENETPPSLAQNRAEQRCSAAPRPKPNKRNIKIDFARREGSSWKWTRQLQLVEEKGEVNQWNWSTMKMFPAASTMQQTKVPKTEHEPRRKWGKWWWLTMLSNVWMMIAKMKSWNDDTVKRNRNKWWPSETATIQSDEY